MLILKGVFAKNERGVWLNILYRSLLILLFNWRKWFKKSFIKFTELLYSTQIVKSSFRFKINHSDIITCKCIIQFDAFEKSWYFIIFVFVLYTKIICPLEVKVSVSALSMIQVPSGRDTMRPNSQPLLSTLYLVLYSQPFLVIYSQPF